MLKQIATAFVSLQQMGMGLSLEPPHSVVPTALVTAEVTTAWFGLLIAGLETRSVVAVSLVMRNVK